MCVCVCHINRHKLYEKSSLRVYVCVTYKKMLGQTWYNNVDRVWWWRRRRRRRVFTAIPKFTEVVIVVVPLRFSIRVGRVWFVFHMALTTAIRVTRGRLIKFPLVYLARERYTRLVQEFSDKSPPHHIALLARSVFLFIFLRKRTRDSSVVVEPPHTD